MGSKTCMNVLCGDSASAEWKKGWPLRSGESAVLCLKCGSAYEQSIFCDIFHSKDSGWRDCASCGKRLHCGCVASQFLVELLDSGGVKCTICARRLGVYQPGHADKHLDVNGVDKQNFMQLASNTEDSLLGHSILSHHGDSNGSIVQMKQEGVLLSLEEMTNSCFLVSGKASNGAAQFPKLESLKSNIVGNDDDDDALVRTNLSISLGAPTLVNERDRSKISCLLLPEPRSRHLLPKPPKSVLSSSLDANRGTISQIRVARPPAEGRGRNQLLPRYWPRITDQELQQISGDSNSTIVPLFEKVLSASDAGRIGRLVLPKACAEAYFPPISQPEGLPLRIQDVRGKEWVFQFRFWPNNNSRMYVLEGVTPCIQSMQLQAGDTVTFSRMDPEGKLIMGFRKASTSVAVQDSPMSAISSSAPQAFFSGSFENLPFISGYSTLLQSIKGNSDPNLNALSKHFTTTVGDISWQNAEKHDAHSREAFLPPVMVPDRKRARNIGITSKRLLIDSQEALELKLTWEEAQDLLCPPLTVKPSIVMIEDHAFEEYDEPPVIGKRSIFIVRSSGVQEQWAQCDICGKWRKLPVDTLLPPKWTCADNSWDQSRCSCSVPDELAPRELENLLKLNKEFKRQRLGASLRPEHESSASGLDALANAAIIGYGAEDGGTASVSATTTKHPRHRPGCSCIVCIQPPSGKGKHKPTCTCNVCMTVKRRFKTLMMRKKKRQSEREAELASRNRKMWGPAGPTPTPTPTKDETEVDSTTSSRHSENNEARNLDGSGHPTNYNNNVGEEAGKGRIDLNFQPQREMEEDPRVGPGSGQLSMMSLLRVANQPLETYLKQTGLMSLVVASEPQASSSPDHVQPQVQASAESEDQEKVAVAVAVGERDDDNDHEEEYDDDEVMGGEEEEGNVAADHTQTEQNDITETRTSVGKSI